MELRNYGITELRMVVGIFLILAPWGVNAAGWADRSAEIPQTVLDEHAYSPYLSIASGRGDDWLAGNSNRLFHVLKDKTIDLTPELKNYGFISVRQVATDGQGWLVIGDSTAWHSQPDLALNYDGMYSKNVSKVLSAIEPDEWIGQVSGRRGMWLIPTSKRVYLWNITLEQPAKIELPQMMQGGDPVAAYPVRDGWILTYLAEGGLSRKYVYFDGMEIKDVDNLMGKMDTQISAGTNGGEFMALCAKTDKRGKSFMTAVKTDGKRSWDVSHSLRTLNMPTLKAEQYPFINSGIISWNGRAWVMTDADKHMARYDNRNTAKRLADTKDTFLNIGYGNKSTVLLVGYNYVDGMITGRMAMYTE